MPKKVHFSPYTTTMPDGTHAPLSTALQQRTDPSQGTNNNAQSSTPHQTTATHKQPTTATSPWRNYLGYLPKPRPPISPLLERTPVTTPEEPVPSPPLSNLSPTDDPQLASPTEKQDLTPPTPLSLPLLTTITQFLQYCGCWYTPGTRITHTETLIFLVEFSTGKKGLIQVGEIIPGRPASVLEAFHCHRKIRQAKDMIGGVEWGRLQRKFGMRADNMMLFEWLNTWRCVGFGDGDRPGYGVPTEREIRARRRQRGEGVGVREWVVQVVSSLSALCGSG
ncbi:hypothetical protein BJX61DRAFT_546596 [Aspergillus egyptiacus]|nr:hypothetical protein BJX61DRAFT_546596 [Aspergillus egyptiacus]